MARIWSPEATVPAACITYSGGNLNDQPILFTTQHSQEGYWDFTSNGDPSRRESKKIKLEWVIKTVEVTTLRDWSTSQAMIVLACNLPDSNAVLPPLPDLFDYRGGNHRYLTVEDEIRIYQGYVQTPSTPITGDMLDEIPFSFQRSDESVVSFNPKKSLAPVFWGFIDKMEFSGNSKGLQLVLSCRDRTRIFADTRVLSIPAFAGVAKDNTSGGDLTGFQKGDRAAILLQLANAAAGNTTGVDKKDGKSCGCWKPINPGSIVLGYSQQGEALQRITPRENPARWTQEACFSLMADKAEPRFHIWAERPPIKKGEANQTLQVLNKTPLEVIDYLAKIEERPIDFYASHVNGDFIFGPRSIDMTGLEDELRSYRTYFFRSWPKELNAAPPAPNQMALSIRSMTSTLSTYNKFLLIDSTANGGSSSLLQNLELGLFVLPWGLDNRTITPPCRTMIINDGAISSSDDKGAEALLVTLAQAQMFGRDVNGVQIELLGDPTFYPGEAIRVYNTYLHDNQTYVLVDEDKQAEFMEEIKQDSIKLDKDITSQSKQEQAQSCGYDKANDIAKRVFADNPSRLPTNLQALVIPLYKIRAVKHTLKADGGKRGYLTTLNCVADV